MALFPYGAVPLRAPPHRTICGDLGANAIAAFFLQHPAKFVRNLRKRGRRGVTEGLGFPETLALQASSIFWDI
jgi:hypothetical protein